MNKLLLEYEIKRHQLTINEFCKKINISRSSYYRKCNGESEFTRNEIEKIMKLLNLENPCDIFFTEQVS